MSAIQGGHAFAITAAAVFPKLGALEQRVHKQLREFRVDGFGGREWFETSLETVVGAIHALIKQENAPSETDDSSSDRGDCIRPTPPLHWDKALGFDDSGNVTWINPDRLCDALALACQGVY
jgi:hypothetical protein